MAADTFERKVYFVGAWKGDVVSDNIFQHLGEKSESDKGKKVRLRLSRQGIQLRKSAMFQGSALLDAYRIESIYFMTVNQQSRSCLLCILRDSKHKYAILAFRCYSDLDAGLFVQNFKEYKGKSGSGSYEMKRVGDGNWTLRGLGGPASRHHLRMTSKTPNGTGNGIIRNARDHHSEVNHVTVIPNQETITRQNVIIDPRTQQKNGVPMQAHHVDVDQMSEASDVTSLKDELETLSHELRDIKILLETSTGISVDEHIRRAGKAEVANPPNHMPYGAHPDGIARVYVSNRPPPKLVPNTVPVFHSDGVIQSAPRTPTIKTAEVASVLKREFSNGEEQAPRVMAVPQLHGVRLAASVSRTSVKRTAPETAVNGLSDGNVSGKNSVRVKFDSSSMRLANEQRSRSMRIKSDFMVPSTVERPIEKTYARPTILKSETSKGKHVRRSRPQSVYLISGVKPVKIQNPKITYEAQF